MKQIIEIFQMKTINIFEATCIFINANMFVHLYVCTHFTTSHYVYNYILMDIHKYIIIHTLLFIQILMSVVMVHMFVPSIHVWTLMEAILVDVILDIHWGLMRLRVMVSTNVFIIVIINLHIHTNIHSYIHTYLLNI